MKELKASVLVIVSGICWGMIGIFSRPLANLGYSAFDITFIRSVITAIGLSIYLLLIKPEFLRIKIKDLWMFFGTGIFSIVFFNIMYFITIEHATLSMAAVLLYTAPFFVIIISALLFRERITPNKVIATIIAGIGAVFTTGVIDSILGGGLSGISGYAILTGVASGFGYSLYSIFGHIALKRYNPITVTVYTFIVAAVVLAPFSISEVFHVEHVDADNVINVVGIGIVATVIPYICYTTGLSSLEPGKASIMAFVEPMVATIIGILVFGEKLTAFNIVGVILIFIGIIILNLGAKKMTEGDLKIIKLEEYAEIDKALELVKTVFLEFEAPDYSDEGVEEFNRSICDTEYLDMITIYAAYIDEDMKGVIATRSEGTHVALFFVKGEYHRRGIGRCLFEEALKNCKSDYMTVNSSPYAVAVYHQLGFVDTDIEQDVNGIKFTPMQRGKMR